VTTSMDERHFGRDLYLPADPGGRLLVTPTGDLQTVAGRSNLEAALLRRLVASPGSLLHRPEYGVGVMDVLETANTPAARSQLANLARRNLLRDPRISEAKVGVALGLPDDPRRVDAITLTVSVTLRRSGTTEQFVFGLGS